MSYNTADPNRGQPIYTNSGIDASMMSAQHHINFIPVPLAHNVVDVPTNSGGFPVHTNVSSSVNNILSETRPKPQIMVLEKMKQLRDEGKYCDLFIDVKGMRFIAHKSLVAAWSPYFDEALTNTNYVEKDLLIIHYENYEVFADLLEFLYTGSIALRDTNFLQLLHLAVSFKIDLLKYYCEEFLRCNLHLGNFVSTYFLSRKYSLESLEEYIVGFLQSNLSDAVKQTDFLQMTAEKFHSLLSKGSMIKLKPEIKLFLVISWVGFEVQPREKFLVLLLKHIDWSSVASDFLLEISRTENFFTTHESSLYLLLQTLFSSGISLGPYKETFKTLRHTYSHLLSEVVQSGIILPEVDEFVAVTAVGTSTRRLKIDASMNTDGCIVNITPSDAGQQIHDIKESNESSQTIISDNNTSDNYYDELSGFVEEEDQNSYTHEEPDRQEELFNKHPVETQIPPSSLEKKEEEKKKLKLMSKDTISVSKKEKGSKKSKQLSNDTVSVSKISPESERQLRSTAQMASASAGNTKLQKEEETSNDQMTTKKVEEKDEEEDEAYEDFTDENDEDYKDEDEDKESDNDVPETKTRSRRRTKLNYNVQRYECPHCSYNTIVENRYKKHLRWNHENNVTLLCTICHDFETKSNRRYNDHMRTHFQGPPFNCEFFSCEYSTEKFQALMIHRMKHDDQRPFPCETCGARFRTRNNLYAHVKTHTGQRPYKCPHCPKAFAVKNTLDQHLVIHDDLRPYLCDLCGFATKYQSHLTSHKRTHTGELFHCEQPKCNYATPKRSQLKCHMRTHLGIRSFTCTECGKSFIEKSHLTRHQTIHMQEKPFKCSLCDYCTARKDKLKYHLSKTHEGGVVKKPKGRPRVKKGQQKSPETLKSGEPLPEAVYIQGVPKNFDHSGYTIQGISADSSTSLTLEDIRRAQFGGSNLEGLTIQVPISMEHLVIPLDDVKTTNVRPLPSTSPVTPVTLIPEDHQTYIQNVMTQVPMTTVQQQQQQSGVQNQDLSGLGAFMAFI